MRRSIAIVIVLGYVSGSSSFVVAVVIGNSTLGLVGFSVFFLTGIFVAIQTVLGRRAR